MSLQRVEMLTGEKNEAVTPCTPLQTAAIEAAATIEYDAAARHALFAAAMSLLMYIVATVFVLYVIALQAAMVWHAANIRFTAA